MSQERGTDERATGEVVSVAEALELAVQLHRGGKAEIAEAIYQRILEAVPSQPDALHFYGLLHHQRGQSEQAITLIERAIKQQPDEPGMFNNLGNIFAERDEWERAVGAYGAALALDEGYADAHSNLGAALRRLKRVEEAEAALARAIALDPTHREAHDNLGRLFSSQGRIEEAIAAHVRALELEPRNADTRRLLAATYATTGRIEDGLRIVREWLTDEPDSPTALHLQAALSGENVPDRASDRYVATMFDRFAASFDAKLSKLEYRAPDLVASALAAVARPEGTLAILDAGCGTGLCGPLIRTHARDLVGVDLSPNMLAHAQSRGVYDTLVPAELTAHLLANPARYDVVISADTLCYFGDLHAVIAAASAALRPGGILIFTVEAEADGAGFRINPHGRFSHSAAHVEHALEEAGLTVVALDAATLRLERGEPVRGLVASARRI